jgi:hypothetical protein
MATHFYSPGERVPASGIYKCACNGHERRFSTDVKGHVFPATDRPGGKWFLVRATPHR